MCFLSHTLKVSEFFSSLGLCFCLSFLLTLYVSLSLDLHFLIVQIYYLSFTLQLKATWFVVSFSLFKSEQTFSHPLIWVSYLSLPLSFFLPRSTLWKWVNLSLFPSNIPITLWWKAIWSILSFSLSKNKWLIFLPLIYTSYLTHLLLLCLFFFPDLRFESKWFFPLFKFVFPLIIQWQITWFAFYLLIFEGEQTFFLPLI